MSFGTALLFVADECLFAGEEGLFTAEERFFAVEQFVGGGRRFLDDKRRLLDGGRQCLRAGTTLGPGGRRLGPGGGTRGTRAAERGRFRSGVPKKDLPEPKFGGEKHIPGVNEGWEPKQRCAKVPRKTGCLVAFIHRMSVAAPTPSSAPAGCGAAPGMVGGKAVVEASAMTCGALQRMFKRHWLGLEVRRK